MSTHKLISSFNAGELSPLMDSRVAVEKYESGCRRLRNFIIHTHGPVMRRPGMEYIADVSTPSVASRLIDFNFSTTTRYVIEMTAGNLVVWDPDSGSRIATKKNIPHDYQPSEFLEVQTCQINDVMYLAHTNHPPMKLTRLAPDDWTLENVDTLSSWFPPLLDEHVEEDLPSLPAVTQLKTVDLALAPEAVLPVTSLLPSFNVGLGALPTGTPPPTTAEVMECKFVWTLPHPVANGNRTVTLQILTDSSTLTDTNPAVPVYAWKTLKTWTLAKTVVSQPTEKLKLSLLRKGKDRADLGYTFAAETGSYSASLTPQANVVYSDATRSCTLRVVYGPVGMLETVGGKLAIHGGASLQPGGFQLLANVDLKVVADIAFSSDFKLKWSVPTVTPLPTGQKVRLEVLNAAGAWVQAAADWTLATSMNNTESTFRVRYTNTGAAAIESYNGTAWVNAKSIAAIKEPFFDVALRLNYYTEGEWPDYHAPDTVNSQGQLVTGPVTPACVKISRVNSPTSQTLLQTRPLVHYPYVTVPAGKWQANFVCEGPVPTAGAKMSIFKWDAKKGWLLVVAQTLAGYKSMQYTGPEFQADTKVRFVYEGVRQTKGFSSVERLVYLPPERTTLAVDATNVVNRTMRCSKSGMFKPEHVNSFWQIVHRRDKSTTEIVGASNAFPTLTSPELRVVGKWDLYTYGNWQGTLYLERKTSNAVGTGSWEILRSWTSNKDHNVTVGGEQLTEAFLRLRISTGAKYEPAAEAAAARFLLEAADARTYGLVRVTGIGSDGYTAQVNIIHPLGSTDPTALWSEGAWSDLRKYPGAVTLHQGRLWFGGTPSKPQTLWGSVSGDFENFRRSTSDDGSIAVTLASQSGNQIRWLSSAGSLLVGTGGEEWAVSSSADGGVITPVALRAERQSAYSSSLVPARMANDVTLFVQRDGRHLRQLTYASTQEGYTAADLTVLAPHVTGSGILQLAFQQAPTAILWAVTRDGNLIGMTFEREQNVFGWHVHTTQGRVESVAVLQGTPSDEVWVTVNRGTAQKPFRTLERLSTRVLSGDWSEPARLVYLDCAKLVDIPGTASTTVAGFAHLNGREVSVLADGVPLGKFTPANGRITLPTPAKVVIAGLPYTSELQPMKQELQLQDGSAQGRRQKLQGVTVRVDNSSGGQVFANPNDDSLAPAELLPPELTLDENELPVLYTGERSVILDSRHESAVNVTVTQSAPLPLNITGLILKFDVYGA